MENKINKEIKVEEGIIHRIIKGAERTTEETVDIKESIKNCKKYDFLTHRI